MKQLFGYLLLTVFSNQAFGEWVKIDELDTFSQYYESDSIRKSGEMRKIWTLMDSKEKQANGSLSSKILFQFDCNEEQVKFLDVINFSGRMGKGVSTGGSSGKFDLPWDHVPPQSTLWKIMTISCAKK